MDSELVQELERVFACENELTEDLRQFALDLSTERDREDLMLTLVSVDTDVPLVPVGTNGTEIPARG